MELSETERLMLTKKQEEICSLTLWILDHASEPESELQIKKNFTQVISQLNQIAAYSHTGRNLERITESMNLLFLNMSQEKTYKIWISSPIMIEVICNYLNSVKFQFGKRGLKITIPKININFGTITNK
jgi:hypothetical protein